MRAQDYLARPGFMELVERLERVLDRMHVEYGDAPGTGGGGGGGSGDADRPLAQGGSG